MPALLSIDDLCTMLRCSRKHLWARRRRGEIPPAIQISPSRIAWTADSIVAWLGALPRVDVLDIPPDRRKSPGRPAGLPATAMYAAPKKRGRPKKLSHVERARRAAREARREA